MVARDTAQINKIRAHLSSGGSFNDEALQETFDELKRDYIDDLRRYPVLTALSAFATIAISVAPFGLLFWWIGWCPLLTPVEQDETGRNDKVDKALSDAIWKGWRDGKNERE